MQWEKEIEGVLHLKHKFHEHALAWVDINQSEEKAGGAYCKGCGQVVSGPCFSCANSNCNYHLHQKCARAPSEIDHHPLHLEHPRISFALREGTRHGYPPDYACALCKEKSNVFFYECRYYNCYFCLDINCALYLLNKVGENFYHSKDETHQLAFILFENHHKDNKLNKTVSCYWCHEPLADSDSTYIYVSAECKFQLHKRCFDKLPTQIDHPCHRIHPLILEFDNKNRRFCKLCQKGDAMHFFYYHCSPCNFDIHLQCIWPRHVIEDKKHYEHPFTLLWRQDSFTCDACGTNGDFASYVCCTCHIYVHEKCVLLPRTIKISRHDHPLSHKYLLNTKQLDCQVCFDPVKTEFGHYHCLEAADNCSYVAHVECATGDPSLYDVIDHDENYVGDEDMKDCSSFRVIDGDATKIRHFLHDEDEHDLVLLVLDDQMKQHEDSHRCCDGCMVSISGSSADPPFYYSCLKCDFLLHKGCAELPKKKHHWYHRFLATLQSDKDDFFWCQLCDHQYTGFYYDNTNLQFCLRCAKTPNIIKSGQVHKHKVFFDHKCRGRCNACGRNIGPYGAFRCKDCSSFKLDFACITLPPTVENKTVCDQHSLQLITYGTEEEEEEEEEAYCDICEICERKRDPKHWYYKCATCDTSAHPNCVLGQHPFIKTATRYRWRYCRNGHEMRFARKKIYEYPPQCFRCGKHCPDLFFECAPCNYIIHWECP
ncbi:Zinc finger, PHD-type [Corchorus olitorius]|uniref:Zinc finger, PHD-type n=1 Tax=Corchorus olitorius TaxID=93759 RepID=A0A1R3JQN4_9ROSI|nr:Zinc finger, PHD-type [Corchorus olitorius]